MEQVNKKTQIHVSMLTMACGEAFRRRYGARFGIADREEIMPPGIALVTGNAVHTTVEKNLRNKTNGDGLLPAEAIKDAARDYVHDAWQAGVMLTEDEAADANKTLGDTVDMSIALSLLHHSVLAPQIEPAAVEEKFVLVLNDFPYDLAGKKDIREVNGAIRDTKTSGRSPSGDAKTLQLQMYCLNELSERKKLPPAVYIDYLVKLKSPKVVTVDAKPESTWLNTLWERIEYFRGQVDAALAGHKAFPPLRPEDPLCCVKYCGYARTCRFWSGR